jgi:hypothetical protein
VVIEVVEDAEENFGRSAGSIQSLETVGNEKNLHNSYCSPGILG